MIFIRVAKSAGFCFGVKRSIAIARKARKDLALPVYTNGDLIHNPSMIAKLGREGISVLTSSEPVPTIVSRSHGTGQREEAELRKQSQYYVDATCPYVKRIHSRIEKEERREILIIGKKSHPEVQVFLDRGKEIQAILETEEDIINLSRDPRKKQLSYLVLVQTTYSLQKYKAMIDCLTALQFDILAENTICESVCKRQKETEAIAKMVDYMIVLGGKKSSNTRELFHLAQKHCSQVFYWEEPTEIDTLNLEMEPEKPIYLGITAGASTPTGHITETISYLKQKYGSERITILSE